MITIILSFLIFIMAALLHVLFCYMSPVKNLKGKLFMQISGGGLLLLILLGVVLSLPLLWTSVLFYVLLLPMYLIVYVTTELVSPSKKILKSLSQSSGLTYEELLSFLKKENLVGSRLDELVESGCVRTLRDRYALTPSGATLASFLEIFGKILGRGVGG